MPVERLPISVSQLSELLGVEPERFIGVEQEPVRHVEGPRSSTRLWIVLEKEEPRAD